jgi:hypothetical protein
VSRMRPELLAMRGVPTWLNLRRVVSDTPDPDRDYLRFAFAVSRRPQVRARS